jgi:hypothetical protein
MAKREFTVILDSRNRELRYVWPGESIPDQIRLLKERGKKPWRIIKKVK